MCVLFPPRFVLTRKWLTQILLALWWTLEKPEIVVLLLEASGMRW